MSIPPPNSYDNSGFGTTSHIQHYESGGYGDPYASGGSYGGGNPYQAYEQQLRQYISQMQMLYNQTMDGNTKMQIQQNLNVAYQYLQQIGADLGMGNSMPMGGGNPMEMGMDQMNQDPYGMGLGPDGQGQGSPYPVSYQDSSHVVSEEGEEIAVTMDGKDPETRPVDFYQPEVTVTVPMNASQVKVTSETDENGKTVYVFKIALANGTTKEYRFHDPKHIKVEASKTDNVVLDASLGALAKNVKVHEIGYQEDFKGTIYDEEDGDKFVWNTHDSVDYFTTEGEEINEFYCDTLNYNVMNRDNTIEVTRTGEHEYTIVEKDPDGNTVRESHGHQLDMLNFNGVDAENFFYKDATNPDSAGLKAFSDNSHDADSQITVGGVSGAEGEGEALNPEYKDEDTIPDSVKGKDAYYKNLDSGGVTIHNYEKDDVDTHHITTVETVDLYATDADQQVEITDNGDGSYTIKMGKDTYIVDGPPSKINIHALPKNVKYNGNPYVMGVDERITVTGEETAAADLVEAMSQNLQDLFAKAKEFNPDLTEAEFIQAMNDTGVSEADLTAVPPNEKLINFLRAIDPDLDSTLKDMGALTNNLEARRKVADRLASLLGAVMGTAVTAMYHNHPLITPRRFITDMTASDDLAIGGQYFDIIKNATGELKFSDQTSAINDYSNGKAHYEIDAAGNPTGLVWWKDGSTWMSEFADSFTPGDIGTDIHEVQGDVTSSDISAANRGGGAPGTDDYGDDVDGDYTDN